MPFQSNVPPGELGEKWTKYRSSMPLVAPNNKRRIEVIIVGTGLAGGAAAATLGELGYKVKCFTFHDSPRRAHSIAAQGGINAAKNYQTMATRSTACSTIPSKGGITAAARPTFTAWPRYRSTSSTRP